MSLVQKPALRQMRIISVPLTRPRNPNSSRTDLKRIVTYYQFQISSAPSPVREAKPRTKWQLPKEGILKFLQHKATSTWAEFGKAKEGSWKVCYIKRLFYFVSLRVFRCCS